MIIVKKLKTFNKTFLRKPVNDLQCLIKFNSDIQFLKLRS